MGNVESQNGDQAFYGNGQGHLSRKHMSRSLRLSNKQSRHSRHVSSGKVEHRNSETSTRSSSTPSIPQSLAENGLEPFNESSALLPDFGSPIWVDRVAMNLRPVSFHTELARPSAEVDAVLAVAAATDGRRGGGAMTYLQRTSDGTRESAGFKKKRSKSADMWREDSLEFSLSDLSQEHLTSTEEIVDTADEKDYADCGGLLLPSSPEGPDPLDPLGPLEAMDRANSLDELYGPKSPARRSAHHHHHRFAKCGRGGGHMGQHALDDKMAASEDDGTAYGAYTLPCRRSHCLSEGPSAQQGALCTSMHGRRAQTTQVRPALHPKTSLFPPHSHSQFSSVFPSQNSGRGAAHLFIGVFKFYLKLLLCLLKTS